MTESKGCIGEELKKFLQIDRECNELVLRKSHRVCRH
jgi:hypothetical protein